MVKSNDYSVEVQVVCKHQLSSLITSLMVIRGIAHTYTHIKVLFWLMITISISAVWSLTTTHLNACRIANMHR